MDLELARFSIFDQVLALTDPVHPGLILCAGQAVIKRGIEISVASQVREPRLTHDGSPQHDATESIALDRLQSAPQLLVPGDVAFVIGGACRHRHRSDVFVEAFQQTPANIKRRDDVVFNDPRKLGGQLAQHSVVDARHGALDQLPDLDWPSISALCHNGATTHLVKWTR